MRLGILGPLLVIDDAGAEVAVAAARQRTLLAALLVKANRIVPAAELAEIVWDGTPPPGVGSTLRSYVMRLRHAVGPAVAARIRTGDPGYMCQVADDELDVRRFEALCRRGAAALKARSWQRARDVLSEALGLWRGIPLADVGSQLLQGECVPPLEQARLQALEWRIEADLHLGRHEQLVPELHALVEAHPLRERGDAQLMLALYRCGRRAEALDAFGRIRRVLAEELGIEPGPELQDLHRQILAGKAALATPRAPDDQLQDFADAVRPVAVPRQLPPAVGYFTGRIEELATLSRLVAGARQDGTAVVISAIGGTAGVGKTALAVHFAHRVAEQFPDGQLYMNLRGYDAGAPLSAADALASFLGALGLHGPHIPAGCEERAATYRSLLAGRRMLIVLDNVHRSEQVRPLLPGTGGCAVLVTSRDNLAGLVARDGAVRLELDVLSLEASVAALRDLIGTRADQDPQATALLAARCCRLPLALRVAAELAIGRPAIPLAVLAEELADLQHRLDVLDAGGDEATAVRAVFSWSYRHLDAEVARAFRLAALHPGADFDRHAVAALLGTGPQHAGRLLNRLAQAHLVHATGGRRFGMHDLLRGYALERAAAEDGPADRAAAVARLLDHYLHTAAAAMDTLFPTAAVHRPDLGTAPCALAPVDGPETARAWLDAERANLIATASFAANDGASNAHATKLSATVGQYFQFGHHLSEAVTLHGHALRAAQRRGDRAAEATALSQLGFLEWQRGRSRRAADCQQRALTLFDATIDRVGLCRALHRLALAERHLGNLAEAAAHAERVLTLSRQAEDRLGQAHALKLLGTISRAQGAFLPATDLLHQALALLDELGERPTRSVAIKELGIIDLRFGRLAAAKQRLEQAMQLAGEVGNVSGQAEALSHLGLLHLHYGRHQLAAEHQQRALTVFRPISDRHGEAEVLARLALAELHAGHTSQARNHLEGALTIAGTLNARLVETTVLNSLGDTLLAAGQPLQAAARFTAALALTEQTGQRDTQARAHDGLARVHTAVGDRDRADRHRWEALAIYTALGVPEGEPSTDALLCFRQARKTTGRGRTTTGRGTGP